jgi:hypothetical protein
LSAYGKPLAFYEYLVQQTTNAEFHRLFGQFTTTILRDDCQYPIRSVVCSVGFGSMSEMDLKFELCGHCAFDSDVQARMRILDWLEFLRTDPAPYLQMLEVLSEGRLSEVAPDLHCYAGIGWKCGQPYSTLYLKSHASIS